MTANGESCDLSASDFENRQAALKRAKETEAIILNIAQILGCGIADIESHIAALLAEIARDRAEIEKLKGHVS